MKYLKNFEQINESSNWESLKGSKVIRAEIKGKFILKTEHGTLNIACSGGNDVDISLGRKDTNLNDLRGTNVEDIQMVNDYTAYIKFDNAESINVYDDTGGEGIEMWMDKK